MYTKSYVHVLKVMQTLLNFSVSCYCSLCKNMSIPIVMFDWLQMCLKVLKLSNVATYAVFYIGLWRHVIDPA